MPRCGSLISLMLAAVVLWAIGVPSLDAQPSVPLEPCTVRGLSGDVRCGVVRVAEDRRHPNTRQIDLHVVVARATGP